MSRDKRSILRSPWILLALLFALILLQILSFKLSPTKMSHQRNYSTASSTVYSSGTVLRTKNFIVEIDAGFALDGSALVKLIQPRPIVSSSSSSLFRIRIYHAKDPNKVLWQTSPGVPFIRAAIGNDSLTPGNGEYRIIQNNTMITTHQTISFFGNVQDQHESPESDPNSQMVKFEGVLLYQKTQPTNPRRPKNSDLSDSALDEPSSVLKYRFLLFESASDVLELQTDIEDHENTTITGYDRILLTYYLPDNEQIFGLGEQFSFWNLNGLRVPILTREQGIGRGIQPVTYILNHLPPKTPSYAGGDTLSTYTAIGHYITSDVNSAYLHNTELAFFDFSATNRTTVEVVSRSMRLSIFYGERPLDLISTYTRLISGRMSRLPSWATGEKGAVVGIQGGENKVIRVIETLMAWKVKIAAVWLQDWVGMRSQPMDFTFPIPLLIPGFPSRTTATLSIKSTSPQKRLWWNWEYDRCAYPNWPSFVKRLNTEYNIKVLTYINPFLTDIERGGKPATSFEKNYFKEASEKGYLVKHWVNTDGNWELVDYVFSSGPGILAGMIDVTSPDARRWYKDIIINNMIRLGVSGWMADFAEYLPFDGIMHLNKDRGPPLHENDTNSEAMSFHNVYPLEWAKLNREAVDESRRIHGKEILFFTRSAAPESPRFSQSFWLGDQMHTYDHLDGLESSIFAHLSSSLSGMAYTHSDIGGYTTVNVDPRVVVKVGNRTSFVRLPILERRARFVRQHEELFERWMEVCSLMSTSMFRTHEGSVPDENIQIWDREDIGRKFAFFTDLFSALASYKGILESEHENFGYSPVRPMFLHFPNVERAVWSMERLQFMLGPLLLVIPITTPGITRLNQQITEPPADDDPDDSGDILADVEDELSGLKLDEAEPDDASSESEEDIDDGPVSFKGQLIKNVKNFSKNYLLATIRNVLSLVNAGHELHGKREPGSKPRFPNYSRNRRKSMNSMAITAPKDLPKPLHGRPYLPPGTWVHVFSKTKFTVTKKAGLFLTESNPAANIAATPGYPAVFLREFTREEMSGMIKDGMNGVAVIEDWKYWIDAKPGSYEEFNKQDIESFIEKGWRKYELLQKSLRPFLDFSETRKYPSQE